MVMVKQQKHTKSYEHKNLNLQSVRIGDDCMHVVVHNCDTIQHRRVVMIIFLFILQSSVLRYLLEARGQPIADGYHMISNIIVHPKHDS